MTDSPYPMQGDSQIVYVREADREQLPDHIKDAPGKIFAVHDIAGNVLALTQDRNMAFAVARRNDMIPVSVH